MSTAAKPLINLAMAAILRDVYAVNKGRENTAQNFRFRGIDDMMNVLHPMFSAQGVVVLPEIMSVLPGMTVREGKNPTYTRILTVKFRFTASDGTSVECVTCGEGHDNSDKGIAKAMSMALKYALIQVFLVPTEDMPDADYDPSIDPHEELKQAEADRQEAALAAKRAGLQASKDSKPPLPSVEENPPELPKTQRQEIVEEVTKGKKAAKKAKEGQSPALPGKTPTAGAQEQETGNSEDGDQIPGIEESTNGAKPAWATHKITALSHPAYYNRLVGDLKIEELEYLETAWCSKPDYQEGIAATPAKSELRNFLRQAIKARKG